MLRFIMLSFGFMGWAFYEMSGGSSFDASEMRDARLAAIAAEKEARKAKELPRAPVIVASAPKVVVDTDPPEVTRVSLNLTTVDDTSAAAPAQQSTQQTQAAVPQNVALVTSSADTPAIIPSLIDPTDGISASETASLTDIRTVSGNRVNVRGGPGTDFGIVARLVRGEEVKILQDDGNGWVRFETLNGDTGGWMADFLLTNG